MVKTRSMRTRSSGQSTSAGLRGLNFTDDGPRLACKKTVGRGSTSEQIELNHARRKVKNDAAFCTSPKNTRFDIHTSANCFRLLVGQIAQKDRIRVTLGRFDERPKTASEKFLQTLSLLKATIVATRWLKDVGN
jgi:hypothetical protein